MMVFFVENFLISTIFLVRRGVSIFVSRFLCFNIYSFNYRANSAASALFEPTWNLNGALDEEQIFMQIEFILITNFLVRF